MFLARKLQGMIVGTIVGMMFAPCPAHSQAPSKKDDRVRSKLSAADKREAVLQRAREQTLAILQSDNACSAWFRETDADAAEVFESLHYEIDSGNASYIFLITDWRGGPLEQINWLVGIRQFN